MLDASARLLRLLSILQTRPVWTGPELAARLQVTVRTLRRDMARLRELEYPVRAAPGVGGGYRLAAGSRLPPLLLDDDEAVAVVLSLRTATSHTAALPWETPLRPRSARAGKTIRPNFTHHVVPVTAPSQVGRPRPRPGPRRWRRSRTATL